jgi:arsenite oxidase small subunit
MRKCENMIDAGRRRFLRGAAVATAGGAAAAATLRSAEAKPTLALVTYPSKKLANIKDLKVGEPLEITYPDADSPGVLIKLGDAVDGGVGPDGDIVAFSTLCPHKGFPLHYVAADKSLNCPGHYSRFDCEKGGLEIWGQATENLPQFVLQVDANGDIHATAVDDLIYGRLTNVLKA